VRQARPTGRLKAPPDDRLREANQKAVKARLTIEAIQPAQPLRIKVITVQPGDAVESLLHRMAGVDRPAERFRVLNGPDAQVKARDRVKVVD
jgi:predicted Zn-dependent protease